ncbi:MAG: universal stress protein [Promethearchaeota archaeon]
MLLGVDDSEEAMRAAKRVIEIQKDSGGNVVAFHSTIHRKSDKNELEHAKKIINEIEKIFAEANVSVDTRIVTDQKPEEYIKSICSSEDYNLIVLGYSGTHGLLRRRVLGSIPTEIMNNALCDVLLVR